MFHNEISTKQKKWIAHSPQNYFQIFFLSQVSEDFLHTTMIYNKNPTTIRMKRVVETSSSLFTTTLAKSCLEQTHGSVFNELPLEYP